MNEWEEKRREEIKEAMFDCLEGYIENTGDFYNKIISQEKEMTREAFQEYCDKSFLANKEIINKILQSKNIEEI